MWACARLPARAPDAFNGWKVHSRGFDETYLDGFSFTHESPRQHIWPLAVAISSTQNLGHSTCPCREESVLHQSPEYVGDNYHCDSSNLETTWDNIFYEKMLFDGTGCPSDSLCCHPPPFSLGYTGKWMWQVMTSNFGYVWIKLQWVKTFTYSLGLVHSVDCNGCRLWWMRLSTALLRQPNALVHSQTLYWQCLVPLQSSSHFTHCDNIASSIFTPQMHMYATKTDISETDISLCVWDTLKHYDLSNVVKVWAGYHMLHKQYLKYLWWHFDTVWHSCCEVRYFNNLDTITH